MSFKRFPGTTRQPPTPWVRPADWPSLPTVIESDQKFVGLHAVWNDESNFCALSAEGAFTVNWGDGVTENFASGANAEHVYSYSDADLSAVTDRGFKCAIVTVTPQAGNNLTKLNLHVKHSTSGLQAYASGFVDIALAGQYLTDLRIGVATPGSATQTITFSALERVNIVKSDIRQASHLFYACYNLRSVVDVATSQSAPVSVPVAFDGAGDTVNAVAHPFRDGDSVIFTAINTTTGITTYTPYFVVSSTAGSFKVATTTGGTAVALTSDGTGTALLGTNFSSMFGSCFGLTSVQLLDTSAGTNFSYMFSACYSLTSVPLLNTSAGTNFSSMFSGCYSLTSVPLLNTSAGTNFSNMFSSCSSLTSLPLLNTAAGTNFSNMFSSCSSLTSLPLLNTAAGTGFSNMFSGCYSLTSVPLLNTSAGTNFNSMFYGCASLTSVTLPNTSAGTNFSYMFQNCYSLTSVTLPNTSAGTNFSYMFGSCYSLTSVPLLNTSAGTGFSGMFSACYSLTSVPLLNTSAGTNFSYMFGSCYSLTSVPLLNTSAGTSFSNMFNNCYSLSNIDATGFKVALSVTSCKLGPAALNKIYTNLPTVTAKTITVTGNWGVASDDPAIATAKGWTVTG